MPQQWFKDVRGNIAVTGAIIICAVLFIVGSGIDLMMVSNQKSSLQSLADSAALSAVREMALVSGNKARIEAVAVAYVGRNTTNHSISVSTVLDLKLNTITVILKEEPTTNFPGPIADMDELTVSATAKLSGESGNVCLIALSDGVKRAVSLDHNSRMTAKNCAIYSNSTDPESMYVSQRANLFADEIFVSGGFKGRTTNELTEPITDAPQITDPLSGRKPPLVKSCDEQDFIVTGNQYLSAGTYCGGLTIDGGSARLHSGIYIIKDGPLTVRNGGTLDGEHVGFYLTGDNAKLDFDYDSNISLSAPKDGDMTGLLFYANPNAETVSKLKSGTKLKSGHLIRSDNARRLVGTIYLPDDKLILDGSEPVADKSEYTVIVAKAFELKNGPNLVLRTDYHLSDIPVPDGVGPAKSESMLIK